MKLQKKKRLLYSLIPLLFNVQSFDQSSLVALKFFCCVFLFCFLTFRTVLARFFFDALIFENLSAEPEALVVDPESVFRLCDVGRTVDLLQFVADLFFYQR